MPRVGLAYEDPDNLVGTIEFDCIVREKHTLSARATEHPIEGSGQGRTDHVHQMPDVLVLEVVASDTPVHPPATQSNDTRVVPRHVDVDYQVNVLPASPYTPAPSLQVIPGTPIPGPGNLDVYAKRTVTERATVSGYDPPFKRRQDVWTELRRLKEAGEIIMVVTSLEVYLDMVIEEVDTECTASNGRALVATITLKRVALVDSQMVKKPKLPGEVESRGRQSAIESEPEIAERTSAAFKVAAKAGLLSR